jgi:hypothetical protein
MHPRLLLCAAILTAVLGAQGTISSLSPANVTAGAATFTLTVNGSGFAAPNVVQWDGGNLPTTFVSANQLAATVNASLVAAGGAHSVRVKVNVLSPQFSNTVTFNVNNPAPVLASISPTSTVVNSASFTLTATGSAFLSAAVVEWNGTPLTTTFGSSTSLTAVVPASLLTATGVRTVRVRNPAPGGGLSGGQAFTVSNNTLPTLTSILPTSVAAGSPNVLMTANGGNFNTSSQLLFDGTQLVSTLVNATQMTVIIPSSLVATGGTHNINVQNPGTGGGLSATRTLTVTNPIPTVSSATPATVTAGSTVNLSVTGTNFVAGSQVRVNGLGVSTTFNGPTSLDATFNTSAASGGTSLAITVFNPAPGGGNSASQSVSVVNPLPTATSINPATMPAGAAGTTITVTGTGFVSTSAVRCNGVAIQTTFSSTTQIFGFFPANTFPVGGTRTIAVFSPGPGGGETAGLTLTIENPAPVLINATPNLISVGSPATPIALTGSDFVATCNIVIDGFGVATTFVDANNLTAMVPSSLLAVVGTRSVSVTNPAPGGGTTGSVSLNVVNPVPQVASITPAVVGAGSAAFVVAVTGSSFVSGSMVMFDGSTGLSTSFADANHVTALVPAALVTSPGAHSISVFNPMPGGGLSNSVSLGVENPLPTVSSVTPASAAVDGAPPLLTVTGAGFLASSQITFNGSPLPTSFVSATTLTAPAPAGAMSPAGVHAVAVLSPAPGGGFSNAVNFTVANPVPTIVSLSPNAVAVDTGATLVTINGSGFRPDSVVDVVGVGPQTCTSRSPTQLTFQFPSGQFSSPALFLVQVTNASPGGGIASAPFTVANSVPTIASIVPSSPPVLASTPELLTVFGTGFHPLSQLKIDGVIYTTTFAGSITGANALSVTVPAASLTGGTHQVTVFNGGNGGGESAPAPLVVENPAPVITLLSPSVIPGGGGDAPITASGSDFVSTTTIDADGIPLFAVVLSPTQLLFTLPAALRRTTRQFTITAKNPTPGGGASIDAIIVTGPSITSCSPSLIPVTPIGSPPVPLTIQGQLDIGTDVIRINGRPVTTTAVNGSTLSCSIDPLQFPEISLPGGIAVTLTRIGPLELVASNAVGIPVGAAGAADNVGTVTLAGAPPGPMQSFNIRVEVPFAGVPVTLLAQTPATPPILLGIAPGFDLMIGPGLVSPIVLLDGLGVFGPPTGTTTGTYSLIPFGVPSPTGILEVPLVAPPPLGFTFSLAAIYADPTSPIGVNATHVSGPYPL